MSRREKIKSTVAGTLRRVLSPDNKRGGKLTAEEEQAVNTQEGIWKYIRAGDHSMVKRYLEEDEKLIHQRGPVGETILHLLFLYNTPIHMKIAKWLMDTYPGLVHTIYEKEPYIGENCLHIAIVNRNYEMVVDLLNRDPEKKLLDARTTGGFFARGKPCYYGESALGFAVCTNQPKITLYLLDHGADIDCEDVHGNNLLHLCVIHNLPDMYNIIEKRWSQKSTKLQKEKSRRLLSRKVSSATVELWRRPNKERFTPFTLAAKMGQKAMFEFLLDKRKQVEWKYGPVTCLVHPLGDLDLDLDLEDDTPHALEIIINEEHTDLLSLPQLRHLINLKWNRFAHRNFLKRFVITAIYLTIFMITTILRHSETPHGETEGGEGSDKTDADEGKLEHFAMSWLGVAIRYCGESLTLLGALYKGRNEWNEMREHGITAYLDKSGSGFLENVVSSCFCLAIIARPFLYLLGSDWGNTIHSLALVLGWMYMLFFLLAFRITGPFVVMIWQMLKADVLRFVIIYGVFLAGFTSAFFVIYDHSGVESFAAILKKVVEAEFDSNELMGGRHPFVAVVLLISYVVTVTILLINLLIAMMGSTFNKISETADLQWELERARIIFSLENEMSVAERLSAKYWIDRDGERFILVEDNDEEHFRQLTEDDKQILEACLSGAPLPLKTNEEAKAPSEPSSPVPSLNLSLSPSVAFSPDNLSSPSSSSSSTSSTSPTVTDLSGSGGSSGVGGLGLPEQDGFDLSRFQASPAAATQFNPPMGSPSPLTSPEPRKKTKIDHHAE